LRITGLGGIFNHMNKDLHKQLVLQRLRTHKAIDTNDLINILTEVEKLTRVAIKHPESNDADVRKQHGRRAEYLISLIKVTKAEDKEHWMN